MNAVMFLALRAVHVLVAGIWIGSTVFISTLLVPAIEASGPSGGQVMGRITRNGISTYMGILGGTTAITGLYLLWRFTGGFDPAVAASHAGLAFGIGGSAGILAGIIGATIVGRSSGKVSTLMGQAGSMTDGPARSALMQQVDVLRRRMKAASRVVVLLQTSALVCMAIGHYV